MTKQEIIDLGFKPIPGKFNRFTNGKKTLYLAVGGYAKVGVKFCATIEEVKEAINEERNQV